MADRDAAAGRAGGDRVAGLDGIDAGGAAAGSAPIARLDGRPPGEAIGADVAGGALAPVELGPIEAAADDPVPPVAGLLSEAGGAAEPGPVALFDSEHIGAARTDVPVADLHAGGSASRRRGRGEGAREVGAHDRGRRRAGADTAGADTAGADTAGADPAGAGPAGSPRRGGHRARGRRERAAAPAGAEPALDADGDLTQPGEPGGEEQPGRRARGDRPGGRRAGGRRRGGQAELDPEVDPVAVAREICLRLLADRARTRQELAQALQHKGVPHDAARSVLDRFDEVGLIDDAAFAGQWVRSRHAHRGLARRAIAVELRRKGVSDDDATEALAEVDTESEERRARELVDRKLRTLAVGTAEKRAAAGRRLVGMLARKGYGAGVAYRVVKEALAERGAEVDELGDAEMPED